MKHIILFFIIMSFMACNNSHKELELPNILWISHEDLGPIYGAYGDEYANTPILDQLADKSIKFTQVFSNAPICAPARSTLITGMYASSLGTQHLRSDIPVPEPMKILPEVMREAGYYTSNNVKTDYNFSHEGRWDESSKEAHWRNRPEGKPFFSVFNFMITHEGPTNALRSTDTSGLKNFHDPKKAVLPPHLPDSPKMREIWAHMYDLLSVFDRQVGDLLGQLEEDGLLEETIIFVFSDHGHGLPGHKRWLDNAGLQVPFLLHVPEKYKHLVAPITAMESDRLVSFVDFAPTTLALAGVPVPDMMEGINFLAKEERKYVFGYRDRADDVYEVSRSVYDGRYLYIRHFMPHLPYYQNALIFNKGGSYAEINRLREAGDLPEATMKMFTSKPVEILYDLKTDPLEQHNLANDPKFENKIAELANELDEWMIQNRDTGLLSEGIMMQQAKGNNMSVYEISRGYPEADFSAILKAAKMVGKINKPSAILPYLASEIDAVRFWALVSLSAYKGDIGEVVPNVLSLLSDEAPAVAIKAAEILIKHEDNEAAFKLMGEMLLLDDEVQVLQAAISVRQLGIQAKPLIPLITEEVFPKYSGEIWGRYKNWSYPMFIGMALDQAQINCGLNIPVRK
ncbi:sulfatase-like hydrolase/transferase [Cyclobacterium sp. 1_MG-2023]|uniref:sulfatase-like hydrolase/transferase n=1 Tax=Cyclobacterium sp. 1_MG-2023 TaxID=3062681 RepID=UPI0026E3EDFB|nr:sulfatase-like hydrolase/transferase [Cyclobacterium sp. 1_MG-2023]MDO6437448.1 sulfatase-like hydrolase/transferase [Cyclobacterium sp. 1_MG-2023]